MQLSLIRNNNLNKEADAGDIKQMTKKINGGVNGLDVRSQKYKLAKKLIS